MQHPMVIRMLYSGLGEVVFWVMLILLRDVERPDTNARANSSTSGEGGQRTRGGGRLRGRPWQGIRGLANSVQCSASCTGRVNQPQHYYILPDCLSFLPMDGSIILPCKTHDDTKQCTKQWANLSAGSYFPLADEVCSFLGTARM